MGLTAPLLGVNQGLTRIRLLIECFHPLRLCFSPYKKAKTLPLLFDFKSAHVISIAVDHLKEIQKYRRPPFEIGSDTYGQPELLKIKSRRIPPARLEVAFPTERGLESPDNTKINY